MENKQHKTPLFEALKQFAQKKTLSFHVPGHKNGAIFSAEGMEYFRSILSIDLTELTGLDDLHAPKEVIAEAEQLASEWFHSDHTFFLVGGSTAGNLAMILATCSQNDKVIVQRNSHKSIFNGLELSGARPVLVAPVYDQIVQRYTAPSTEQLIEAIKIHSDAKVIILTYPDYFGHTYELERIIKIAHQHQMIVLIDEAHGVHFSVDKQLFPHSALDLGADVVVQSAHKMAPAMTMSAYLHIKSSLLNKEKLAHFLQMIQSSSPSYPLMASLDLARNFLATRTDQDVWEIKKSIGQMRDIISKSPVWDLIPFQVNLDDPLKVTLQVKSGYSSKSVVALFESEGFFPELRDDNQILFIHGLQPFQHWVRLEKAVEKITRQLNFTDKHDTMEIKQILFSESITSLAFSYREMDNKETLFTGWDDAIDSIAAEAVIPYPPGVPILVKGERITNQHVEVIKYLLAQQTNFQQQNIRDGVTVFKGE